MSIARSMPRGACVRAVPTPVRRTRARRFSTASRRRSTPATTSSRRRTSRRRCRASGSPASAAAPPVNCALFATLVREGSWVDARIDRALPTAHAAAETGHPPHAHSDRTGRGLRREQLPAGVLRRGRRHGIGPRRWLPRRGQRTPSASGDVRNRGACNRRRGARVGNPTRRFLAAAQHAQRDRERARSASVRSRRWASLEAFVRDARCSTPRPLVPNRFLCTRRWAA